MRVTLKGFFKCTCGKLHCYGGITVTSKCTCGEALLARITMLLM